MLFARLAAIALLVTGLFCLSQSDAALLGSHRALLASKHKAAQQGGGGISTPVALVTNSALTQTTSGSAAAQTTTASASTGMQIVVFLFNVGAFGTTFASLTDSAGNTYSLLQNSGTSAQGAMMGNAIISHAMPIGTSFTATVNGGSNWILGGAWIAPGVAVGVDSANTTNNGSSTSVTVSTGTLAASNEIVFGGVFVNSGGTAITTGAGFTDLYNTSGFADFAYKIVNTNAAVSYAPSWTAASTVGAAIASFQ